MIVNVLSLRTCQSAIYGKSKYSTLYRKPKCIIFLGKVKLGDFEISTKNMKGSRDKASQSTPNMRRVSC
jgi:hypothetical protein